MDIDIYQYDDFRQYLRDAFEARKQEDATLTHRRFSEVAGVRNPGTFHDILQGKRKPSEKVVAACIEIFQLKPVAAEFLRLLIDYKECKEEQERSALFREMQNRRSHSNFMRLNPAQVRYYDDPLYALTLSAIEVVQFKGNFDDLAGFLRPSVPATKLRKCVKDLLDWGLLRLTNDGVYEVVSRFIEPPPTLREPVRRLNREWILQAADAIFKIHPKDRHMSTAILAVSDLTRVRIQEKLEQVRREIFEMAQADTAAETVMQVSLQLFPKSATRRRAF